VFCFAFISFIVSVPFVLSILTNNIIIGPFVTVVTKELVGVPCMVSIRINSEMQASGMRAPCGPFQLQKLFLERGCWSHKYCQLDLAAMLSIVLFLSMFWSHLCTIP
jgi:hypothetical protein